jgi:hypothetical protein
MLGCHVYSAGFATGGTGGDFVHTGTSDSGGVGEHTATDALAGRAVDLDAYGADAGEPVTPTPVIGPPLTVGCSDGTREGFRDIKNWPDIAGCAGGWQWRGLLDPPSRNPRCLRVAGNDSRNPQGFGCSASDLCAPTWHACLNGPEVASHSPTGCESILLPGEEAFFVVMTGASDQGVCFPEPSAENDLHGCGSIGQHESDQCPPLVRRMGFADCMATHAWSCGTEGQSLLEAAVVAKLDASEGGVLCCRD